MGAGLIFGCSQGNSSGVRRDGAVSGNGGLGVGGNGSAGVHGTGGALGGTGGATSVPGTGGHGGIMADGGAVGTGGKTGTGGSSSATCGGITCPAGQFCDLVPNAAGVCAPFGLTVSCPEKDSNPVCGVDNRTYSSDCIRTANGMLKASDGVCSGTGGYDFTSAYLVWQASSGAAGTGPVVLVNAKAGSIKTWDRTAAFSPESPPSAETSSKTLTADDVDSLFVRLMGIPAVPHGTSASDCHARFYYRLCTGCAGIDVSYNAQSQVLPELDALYSWFDGQVGKTAAANPRSYCK